MTEKLLTPSDVADLLGVSTRTVQRLANDGEIRSIRVGANGRFVRFRSEWVDDYVDTARGPAPGLAVEAEANPWGRSTR